ncbi:MAG: SRPBCC family protein [Minicystis sp.]
MFATGERQTEWFQDFVACRWTSPAPHGVGSEREIELKLLTVKERFLAWEPGKRLTFHIHAITLPFVKAMVEDMVMEPLSDRSCRVTWTVHYRPSLLMKLGHPIGRAIFGKMFKGSLDGLAKYAKAHPG